MQTLILSASALELFRLHIELRGNILIDDANREPYLELERAGLVVLGNSFRDGPGTIYRVSKLGLEQSRTSGLRERGGMIGCELGAANWQRCSGQHAERAIGQSLTYIINALGRSCAMQATAGSRAAGWQVP